MGKVVALPIIKKSLRERPRRTGVHMVGWIVFALFIAAAIGFCWWWFIYVATELELM